MILKFKNEKVEGTQDEKIRGDSSRKNQESAFDYSRVIVKKPWGYEYLVFENEHVAIWMLHIVRKRKTSMHCHPNKTTALILLSGNATCSNLEGEQQLGPLDGVFIDKGVFHSTEASSELPLVPLSENGIWVMEIESPPDKGDLIRMKDEYGRAGVAYEGQNDMVFDPADCVRFDIPEKGVVFRKQFQDCVFSIWKGAIGGQNESPAPDALITVVGREPSAESDKPYLKTAGLATYKEFIEQTQGEELDGFTFLTIESARTHMKLSDYIFSRIADLGVKDVFTVSGGAAMHLLDSLGKNESLDYVANHHEQAAAMAAEGCARVTGKPGVALVTSGPGGTNALTGVCGAWIDSIPAIFISGQVTSNTLIGDTGLRQFGIQESDIVTMVKSVTKYAVTVSDPSQIRYHMDKAIHLATTDRPGPVWLDVPLDMQSKHIAPDQLPGFKPDVKDGAVLENDLSANVEQCIQMLKEAERPVLISGYGIRLAKGEAEFIQLIEKLGIPVITSWTSSDLVPSSHELVVGRSGIFGDRAGNFAVQNSDLVLSVGSRLSVPQIGYNFPIFARAAKKIVVDIDEAELKKPSVTPDLPVLADAKAFMSELINKWGEEPQLQIDEWRNRCRSWRSKYPVVLPEYKEEKDAVNSFHFVDVLSENLDESALVVTDMGTSFTCTMQTFKTKQGQRLFTSSGHASMGFGLPGAIGACVGNGRKKTICISGDGGLQMNIQELQTLAHFQLPVILFVLNNQGYLTIKATQQNHFGRFVGSEKSSGITCPDIIKVAEAHGLEADRIANTDELHAKIHSVLDKPGPFVCEVIMPATQPLIPRVSSLKKPDGSIISKPIEDLYPFLDRKEFAENMIVDPVEILKID
jgi:acetolactate synthase I/II/III large subunit